MMAAIMAGGDGTRLRPVISALPKPMAPIAGKPVMEHIICLLKHCGITHLSATLRYMPESITEYFEDGKKFDVRLSYSIEENPLGTAGGVKAAIGSGYKRDVLVISGDAACDFNLHELIECHRRHKSAVTMALFPSKEPMGYGLVLTDPKGLVRSFIEKPNWERVVTNYVNTGIYIISPEAMAMIPENEKSDFAQDLFPALMKKGMRIQGCSMDGYWCDIGTPRAYYQCNLDAIDGKLKLYSNSIPAVENQLRISPHTAATHRKSHRARAVLPCRDRALLMRALSENLMEAGADFTDGINLHTSNGHVRISARADKNALQIESDSARLCGKYANLARFLKDSE